MKYITTIWTEEALENINNSRQCFIIESYKTSIDFENPNSNACRNGNKHTVYLICKDVTSNLRTIVSKNAVFNNNIRIFKGFIGNGTLQIGDCIDQKYKGRWFN